jgi:hypothetical protein
MENGAGSFVCSQGASCAAAGSAQPVLNPRLVMADIETGLGVGFMIFTGGGIRALDQELYTDFDDLRRERALTDDELTIWVATLTHERLATAFRYIRRGQRQEAPLWWAVAHLFNHQTHHRGPTQEGCDPGVTDLFAMLRGEGAPR